MRLLAFILIFFSAALANAQDITCPDPDKIRTTQGWAITSQGNNEDNGVDWDGSLNKDNEPVGDLLTMDLTYAVWLDGYVIRCVYNNGRLANIEAVKGVCTPQGIVQNCIQEKCLVKCVSTEQDKHLSPGSLN